MTWEFDSFAAGVLYASAVWFIAIARTFRNHSNDKATLQTENLKLKQDIVAALQGKQPEAWLESGVQLMNRKRMQPWAGEFWADKLATKCDLIYDLTGADKDDDSEEDKSETIPAID